MAETFDEILEAARRLGDLIRQHPRYLRLREADVAVRADKVATDALGAYQKAASDVGRREAQGQPVEVADKRNLDRLHQAVVTNDRVKAFAAAQADYAELMRKMNDAIFRAITRDEQEPRPEAGPG